MPVILAFFAIIVGCGTATENEQIEKQQTGGLSGSGRKPGGNNHDGKQRGNCAEAVSQSCAKHGCRFISLVEAGYYGGLIFRRVISDFIVQGRDPEGISMGGPNY